MSPKTAGIAAVVIGVLLAVIGGVMITQPPVSIAGALVLVPATLLVSIGCVWMLRHDWHEPWPPDVRPSHARLLRLRRVLLIGSAVLLPVMLAFGVYSAVRGEWWWLIYSIIISANALYNLRAFRKLARQGT